MTRPFITLLAAFFPLLAHAQPSLSDTQTLRATAIAEGSVEVRVVTRALASSTGATLTPEKRAQIGRQQHKVVMLLIARNLVVGNEIFVQDDGSFTVRILPAAVDFLSTTVDVAALEAAPARHVRGDAGGVVR